MKFILNFLITALLVLLLANILPGVDISDYFTAMWVALLLGLLNLILRPILIFLSLPITILTLGLFLFVINALIIMLVGKLINGFEVSTFWSALLFSLCLSLAQSIIRKLTSQSN